MRGTLALVRIRLYAQRASFWCRRNKHLALCGSGVLMLLLTCVLALLLVSDARYLHGHLQPHSAYVYSYHAAANAAAAAAAASHRRATAHAAVSADDDGDAGPIPAVGAPPLPPPPAAPIAVAAATATPVDDATAAAARKRIAIVSMTDFRPAGSDGHRIAQWSWLNKFRYAHRHGYDLHFHTRKHTSWWRPSVWGKLTILLHHLHQTMRIPWPPGTPKPADALPDPTQAVEDAAFAAAAATDLFDDDDRPRPPRVPGQGKPRVRTVLVPRYEWILWIDADTTVIELDTRIEALIAEFTTAYGVKRERGAREDGQWPDAYVLPPHLFATDDHGAVGRHLNAGILLLRNSAWTTELLQSVFSVWQWRYLLHWEQEQKALSAALHARNALAEGLWVQPPCWRFNALNSEYTRTLAESPDGSRKPFLIHTAGCASEAHKLSCGKNYWQRAWREYEKRWNTTLSREMAYAVAANGGQPLAHIFPELYGGGLVSDGSEYN